MYVMTAVVSSNFKLSRFISSSEDEMPTLYPVIPLKPRIHPVKVVEVIPVYDIISSSILIIHIQMETLLYWEL